MKTQYTRVVAGGEGAYGFPYDGVILAQRGDRTWLLTDNWCGSGIEGECYRQHINGHRRAWPRGAESAVDRVTDVERWILATRRNPDLVSPRDLDIPLMLEALAWADAHPAIAEGD